ncbi:MAG: hypothetical protein WCH62_09050, partial [Candidatus Omnitrophota bacterium]
FNGWGISTDCKVLDVTTVFLPAKKCVTLNYSIAKGDQWPSTQLKRDLRFLKLVNSRVVIGLPEDFNQRQIIQRFCSDTEPVSTISSYAIGWSNVDKFTGNKLPILLNSISVADQHD